MSYNGSGTFQRTFDCSTDRDNGIKILADKFDTELDGFATGLTNVICRDGQSTTTARIPFAVGLSFNLGSAGTPSISPTGDTNTGIYSSASDKVSFACGGALVGEFTTAGITITGTLLASSDFAIATNKFTVTASNGNTSVAGTLGVTGAATLSSTLTYGGVTLTNAVTGTGKMVLDTSPTIGGTLTASTITPTTINAFTLGGTISGGGNQINNIIIGNSTPLAGSFTAIVGTSAAINGTETITSSSASALTAGRLGATTPAFQVDASTGTSITGLKVKSAATAGGVDLTAIGETNVNLRIDAAGSGTIVLGGTSTGAITLTRATTLSAALTYGGVTLSNAVTGTGNMVLSADPTLTGTLTAAAVSLSSTLTGGSSSNITINTNKFTVAASSGNTVVAGTLTVGGSSVLTTGAAVTVAQGGTGIASGTSGGVPYYSGSTTIASSSALTAHGVVIGGGSGTAPTSTAAGTLGQALISQGSSADPQYKSGARVLLNTLTPTAAAASSDTSSFTSSYNDYEIVFEDIVAATNAVTFELQVHQGGAFQSTSYLANSLTWPSNATGAVANSATTFIPLSFASRLSNSGALSGSIRVFNPTGAANPKQWTGQIGHADSGGGMLFVTVAGTWNSASALDGFQVLMSSGNIASGTIKIYGML
jgi:hypothetical protein